MNGEAVTEPVSAAGASQARLSVATEDDDVDGPHGRINAPIMATNDFDVDAAARVAGVDVFDNDTSSPASVELWSSTLRWTDMGNGWLIENPEGFSDTHWLLFWGHRCAPVDIRTRLRHRATILSPVGM